MLNMKASLVLALGSAAVGCGENQGPVGPTPGTLTLNLTSPNMDDGAILFRLTGSNVTGISAADPGHYMHIGQSGMTATIVVVGDLSSGQLIEFDVPDVAAVTSYSAQMLAVADRANALRSGLGGYNLTVE